MRREGEVDVAEVGRGGEAAQEEGREGDRGKEERQ